MKDLSFRQLPRVAIVAGATTPAPAGSSFVWSTTENTVLVWSGSAWVAVGTGGGSSVSFSETPPVDTSVLWINTNDLSLNVYYNDGDSSQWVVVSGASSVGGGAGATDLSEGIRTSTTVDIDSSTGASATLSAATTSLAGVMSSADKIKLDGIATGATANSTDAQLRDRSTHTGTQAFSTITGTVPVNQGGTGITSYTTNNYIRASGPTTLEQRTPAQVISDIGAAAASHTHTASQITDFNSASRGQTEAMLVAGSNITLTSSGSGATRQITISSSGGGGSVDPLDLTFNELPVTPPADTVRIFGRRIAGRMLPAFIGPSGLDSALQPWLARNKVGWWNPPGNATTVNQIGMAAATTGTATNANVATTNIHTAMRRLEYAVTTASTSAVAGIRTSAAQFHIGATSTPYGGFNFIARFGPSRGVASNATRRFFAGFTSTTGAPTDGSDPSSQMANAIGVCADAADTNWQIVHRAGSSAATKINTGIPKAYADNTEMFELAIFTAPTGTASVGIRFTRLSDGEHFSHTITTNLPAVTQLLNWQIWNSVGGTSSVIGISIASIYVETDF